MVLVVEEVELLDQGRKIKISHPGDYLATSVDFEDDYSPFLGELLVVSLEVKGMKGRKTPVTKCGVFVFDFLSRSVEDTSFCRNRLR